MFKNQLANNIDVKWKRSVLTFTIALSLCMVYTKAQSQHALVFQSDFGLKDGAVAAMKGVAFTISKDIKMFDITHEIPAYNIWEAAYRLNQTAPYWPAGTVFVSVVDPGVGSSRKSVVLKTKSGHLFVSPDNGTLSLVAETLGIAEVREINEAVHRRKNSEASYTFHGRDVYAYTGAKLAATAIAFQDVGPLLPPQIVNIAYQKPVLKNDTIWGNIPVLDIQYGNVWTNIDSKLLTSVKANYGDQLYVAIFHNKKLYYEGKVTYGRTFSDVAEGANVAYVNSLMNFSIGINQGSFANHYKIQSGPEWIVKVSKTK